jgi:uncharacterized protein (UPF0335 family)
MKKLIRLTENELTNIINRIVSEEMEENTLYSDIMDVIRNSNSSHEEAVSILRNIADEMTSERRVRRDAVSRFRDYRLKD